jgi:hypothetical protein
MTDIVPGNRLLSADFTCPCHGDLLVIFSGPAISGWWISKFKIDGLVKSHKCFVSVIPARPGLDPGAGIQVFQLLTRVLDPVFQRDDDFLRMHRNLFFYSKETKKASGFSKAAFLKVARPHQKAKRGVHTN